MPPNNPAAAAASQTAASSSPGQRPWFQGAPVSKLVAFAVAVSYLVEHSNVTKLPLHNHNNKGSFLYPHRIILSKLSFASTAELVVGTSLLCILSRKMEREMGSRKFVAVLLGTFLVATAIEVVLSPVLFAGLLPLWNDYSGPYPWLGCWFWFYHRYTPRLHPRFFSILGLNISEKSFFYLWFLYAISHHTVTIKAALMGFVIGACLNKVSFLDRGVPFIPERIVSMIALWGSRFLEAPPRVWVPQFQTAQHAGAQQQQQHPNANFNPNNRRFAAAQQQQPQVGGAQARQRVAAPVATAPVVANPAAIEQLVHMGFDQTQVIQALQATNNDVNRAADFLLSSL